MSTERPTFREDFFAAGARARYYSTRETELMVENGRPWPATYVQSPQPYEYTFQQLSKESFGSFISRRREQKGKFFALDVMGAARFSTLESHDNPSVKIDGEAAMTLVDFRNKDQQLSDRNNNRIVIPGNILLTAPWATAKKFIKTHDDTNLPGFDLITCRPYGGWDVIRESSFSTNPHHDLFELFTVQRMVNLLSPQGGTLFTQMASGGNYARWIENLKQTDGIHAEGEFNSITIVKDSPERIKLPMITGVRRPNPSIGF